MDTAKLVKLAEIYADHSGRTLSTVSTYAANDGKFFTRLSEGAGCTLRRANLVISWFDQHWPNDLSWPTSIPRPQKSKDAA